jgi:hypothetical protein
MTGRDKALHDIQALRDWARAALAALETDYTPAQRHDLVRDVRGLEREVGELQAGLAALRHRAEALGVVSPTPVPPVRAGDRIRHAKFGDGTVLTDPIWMTGTDWADMGAPKSARWRFPVEWEHAPAGVTEVTDTAIVYRFK